MISSNLLAGEISWFKKVFKHLTWQEMVTVSTTPKEICKKVNDHVFYAKDDIEYTKDAQQTWNEEKGDCEDFAYCILKACEQKGFKAEIRIFYEKNNIIAHAVVIGEWQEKMWMSSNGSYEIIKSIEDASKKISREMRWNEKIVENIEWNKLDYLNVGKK